MFVLADYIVIEKLSQNNLSITYKAIRKADNLKCILKLLASEYPLLKEITSLQREYEICKNINSDKIIKIYDLVKYQNSFILVTEDIEGKSLNEFLNATRLSIKNFLEIMLQITASLEEIHQCGIIHNDIKPDNIIIKENPLIVKIADFSLASYISENKQNVNSTDMGLIGSLSYMSPEHTGRTQNSLDTRSDLYSLGATAYEMITGVRPFIADDPNELINAHLAKNPKPPHEMHEDIPEIISNIILKLLNKLPERRYQSAEGLKVDLQKCLIEYESTKTISNFDIAEKDSPVTLNWKHKLYGREKQLNAVYQTLERIYQGNSECLFISGLSGSGKTNIIDQIRNKALEGNAFFISGKFNPLERSAPYAVLIQALNALVRRLLVEPENKLIKIQAELKNVIGNNGRIILDVMPDMINIIGPQPPLQKLSPSESQNRFLHVFHDFIKFFATAEHPLIISLDDIHYADASSFKLIETLLVDANAKYLLIIGSYRSNEVSDDHPLHALMTVLKNFGLITNSIELPPLTVEDVTNLLKEILRTDNRSIVQLAELVHSKTAGNPFYINEIVRTIYNKGLIKFSSGANMWSWDTQKILETCPSENVISFVIDNIKTLPANTVLLLQIASCLGNYFDLDLVAQLASITLPEAINIMNEAVANNIIIPDVDSNSVQSNELTDAQAAKKISKEYRFLHDNLQQGIYNSIAPGQAKLIHYAAGMLLLGNIKKKSEVHENLYFNVLNQLNACSDLVTNPVERLELAKLNLLSGIKAKSSAAFTAAYFYLNSGILYLPTNAWIDDYETTYKLFKELSESEFIIGKHAEAEAHFDILLKNAKTILDKSEIYCIKIELYTYIGKHAEAVKLIVEALSLFNIHIPFYPSQLDIFKMYLKLKLKLGNRSIIEAVKSLPEIHDEKSKMIIKILSYSGDSLILLKSNLKYYMLYMSVLMVLTFGISKYASRIFVNGNFFMLTSYSKNTFFSIREYLQISKYIDDKFNDKPIITKNTVQSTFVMSHFLSPLKLCYHMLDESYPLCIEYGNLLDASYCKFFGIRLLLSMGTPINEMIPYLKIGINFFRANDDKSFEQISLMILNYIKLLQNDVNSSVDDLNVEQYLAKLPPAPWISVHKMNAGLKMMHYYILGDFTNALNSALEWYKYKDFSMMLVTDTDDRLMYALSLLANYDQADRSTQRQYLREVKEAIKIYKLLSNETASNFEHKYFLLLAEFNRVKKNYTAAENFYDKAIEQAEKNNFNQYIAIANECAARYYEFINKPKIAKLYLHEANLAYSLWGNILKMKQLDDRYELVRQPYFNDHPFDIKSTRHSFSHSNTNTKAFDIISIIKVIQTISRELDVNKLLEKIMDIMIESAGAEKGMYISWRRNALTIIAKGSNAHDINLVNEQPSNENLPLNIINYVQRSKNPIVVNDAIDDQEFGRDSYIIKNNIRSIVCIPIIYQQQLVSICYFENNLISGAFTPARLEILKIFAGQFAISFENAKVYTAFDRFVPHQFLSYLNKRSIVDVEIGDHTQQYMSILFCDIRDYTSFSEKYTPQETFVFINRFIEIMEPIIRESHGFIDKYIGDAIMALFSNEPEKALHVAIKMFARLKEYNNQLRLQNQHEIAMGIGINTGDLMLGIIGDKERMSGSVVGDAVNIASRIQDLTKKYGAPLIISNETKTQIKHTDQFNLRLIDEVTVKGKSNKIELWEVYNMDTANEIQLKNITLEKFNLARKFFAAENYGEARKFFKEILVINPDDKVVNYYYDACIASVDKMANVKKGVKL